MPIETAPGAEAQVDWSDCTDWGVRFGLGPLHCFGAVLCWSRHRLWWFAPAWTGPTRWRGWCGSSRTPAGCLGWCAWTTWGRWWPAPTPAGAAPASAGVRRRPRVFVRRLLAGGCGQKGQGGAAVPGAAGGAVPRAGAGPAELDRWAEHPSGPLAGQRRCSACAPGDRRAAGSSPAPGAAAAWAAAAGALRHRSPPAPGRATRAAGGVRRQLLLGPARAHPPGGRGPPADRRDHPGGHGRRRAQHRPPPARAGRQPAGVGPLAPAGRRTAGTAPHQRPPRHLELVDPPPPCPADLDLGPGDYRVPIPDLAARYDLDGGAP
jgi:hypothetical protein